MDNSRQKAFVVFNPKAGREDEAVELRSALARHFTSPRWTVEIYETTGKEDVTATCRAACERGASLVISAGGDGTLVGVANALVHSQVPLGILPLGTGNRLARILSVPLKLDEAVQLLAGDHTVIEIDALKVGDRYFFSNVSVGMSPEIMNETKSAQKKRFGRLAYVLTTVKRSSLFHLRRYTLTIDGQTRRMRASEVLISNTKLLEKDDFLLGPPETSVMVNLRCTLSRRTPWAITCGWCGTCSAVRGSQGRSYITGRASKAFALMLIALPS